MICIPATTYNALSAVSIEELWNRFNIISLATTSASHCWRLPTETSKDLREGLVFHKIFERDFFSSTRQTVESLVDMVPDKKDVERK